MSFHLPLQVRRYIFALLAAWSLCCLIGLVVLTFADRKATSPSDQTSTTRNAWLLLCLWGSGVGISVLGGRHLAQRTLPNRHAQERLVASEKQYRQLFDNIDSAFLVGESLCDTDGRPVDYRLVVVNPAFAALTGRTATDLVGRTATEVLPQCEPMWVERFGKVARDGEPVHFTHFSQRLGKHLGFRAFSPAPGQFAVLISDITERMTAELKIKESRQRFADLVNNTNGIVWELDLASFCYSFVSHRAEALLGYPLEDWYRPNFWLEHLHPEDRFWATHYLLEQTELLQNHELEYRVLTRDGRVLWLRDLVSVRVVDGKPIQLCGVMIDISESKRLMLQLQEFRSAVDASHDMVIILDRDYRCLIANRAFLKLRKVEEDEVLGQSLRALVSTETFEKLEPYLQRAFVGEPVTFELLHESPDEEVRHYAVSFKPICEQDAITRVVVVVRDITVAKKAETALGVAAQKAEAANQAKTEFLANMSHELRTPLNGVLGMLQLLTTTDLTPEQQEYIAIAKRSGWSLQGLIKDLLDLTSIEAGKLQIRLEPFDLPHTVQQVNDLFVVSIAEKRLDYTCQIEPSLPVTLRGDETRIRQILFNLLGNAIKFTPEGRRIALSIRGGTPLNDGTISVSFSIVDNGIGIEQDKLATVFDSFSQADNVYRKRYQGAGLGLAIVKRLVELMDGHIQIESQPGVGTMVQVNLPLQPVAQQQERRSAAELSPAGTDGYLAEPVGWQPLSDCRAEVPGRT